MGTAGTASTQFAIPTYATILAVREAINWTHDGEVEAVPLFHRDGKAHQR